MQKATLTGFPSLDAFLGGGWRRGAVTELCGKTGAGKTTLALRSAAKLTQKNQWVALISHGAPFFPPAFHAEGVVLHYLLWIRPKIKEHCRWALDQVTRSGLFPLVIAYDLSLQEREIRRVQLAAEKSSTVVLLLSDSLTSFSSWVTHCRLLVERPKKNSLMIHVLRSRTHLSDSSMEVLLNENQNIIYLPFSVSKRRVAS